MNLQQEAATAAGQQAADASAAVSSRARLIHLLPWFALALSISLIAAGLAFVSANGSSALLATLAVNALGAPTLLVYATLGALLATRRPQNTIGWLFCAATLLVCFSFFAEPAARYALITAPGSLPGGLAMGWLSRVALDLGLLTMFTFLLLLFPDGKLPSRRWRPAAVAIAGIVVLLTSLDTVKPGPLSDILPEDNPFGIQAISVLRDVVFNTLLIAAVAVCALSVILRFRRAEGDERQQIKWFAYAAALLVAQLCLRLVFALFVGPLPTAIGDTLLVLSLAAFPIAAGIAILKYRLYDIDLLINRTLVYVPLTGILAGLYAASIALFQKLFVGVTGEKSDAAIVITTLILASSFTPIKNGLQSAVDKRFKESPDPTKKLRAFGEQVRSFVQLNTPEELIRRLLDEVTSAFNASGGAVYMGQPEHLELVHTTGDWNGEAAMSLPLRRDTEDLGVISLAQRLNGGDYSPKDCQVLQEIADSVLQAMRVAER